MPFQSRGARFEPVERRTLLASIAGVIFGDFDADGAQDGNEPGLAGWTVYLDTNDNGVRNPTEVQTTTAADGSYSFPGLVAGTYVVREILPAGWAQTVPGSGGVILGAPAATSTAPAAPANSFTSTEIVVAFTGDDGLDSLRRRRRDPRIAGQFNLDKSSELLDTSGVSLVSISLPAGVDPRGAVAKFSTLPGVQWAQPNFIYTGDPREFIPNDPSYPTQYHHTLMRNNLAWDTVTASPSVIIAVTDDGVSLTHPDLAPGIWTNPDEIDANGVDDDANGFIDDVRGWDFSSSDNNVAPLSSDAHGTHVAGIAGATTNNSIGVAGTAGGASIMPIRFYGSAAWTSTVTALAFKYAADNGAKILTDSYNVDSFVGDSVFVSAMQYIYDRGVLYFNSGGNAGAANPPRQNWDQVLFVINTTATDVKSSSSNYGWGLDIAAPGTNILSTIPSNSYGNMSGTSMASPNAAAVAALIWSAHPNWTREQVAAQLIGTADNIDALNPTFAGLLGAGRVNSFRAVTQTLTLPRVESVAGLPAQDAVASAMPTSFTVDLANVMDPATVTVAGFELRGDGADNLFGTLDDTLVPLRLNTSYRYGTNRLSFTLLGSVGSDTYRFSALSSLSDPFGQPLDPFARSFSIVGLSNPYRITLTASQNISSAHFGNRDTIAPGLSSSTFEFQTHQAIQLVFDENVSASLTAADLVLHNDTTGQVIGAAEMALAYAGASNTATITFANLLPDGQYTATLNGAGVLDVYGNALGSDRLVTFFVLAGDADRDGLVGITDLGVVASHWQQSPATFGEGDFNYDGISDITDLGVVASNWQKTLPTVAGPQTPATKLSSIRIALQVIDSLPAT